MTENKALAQLFNVPFLELSISMTLTELIETFEILTELMEEKTKRAAWSKFLDRTVFHYIQCLLKNPSKIRQSQPTQVIDKIRQDQETIKDRFLPFMTSRSCNAGVEILEDLLCFFDSSSEFISIPCQKLRRT